MAWAVGSSANNASCESKQSIRASKLYVLHVVAEVRSLLLRAGSSNMAGSQDMDVTTVSGANFALPESDHDQSDREADREAVVTESRGVSTHSSHARVQQSALSAAVSAVDVTADDDAMLHTAGAAPVFVMSPKQPHTDGSVKDDEEPDLDALHKEIIAATERFENAKKQKADRERREREDRERRDHEAAASSTGVGAFPPGFALPRAKSQGGDSDTAMLDAMQQLLSQVHALSKDLGEVKAQLHAKDAIIESLRSRAETPAVREGPGAELQAPTPAGSGPPLPVDRKIAEKPNKYSGNVIDFGAWQ